MLPQGNVSGTETPIPVTVTDIKDISIQRMAITDTEQPVAIAGESIAADNLWKGQPAIVYVVRRPGCLLCREHGK